MRSPAHALARATRALDGLVHRAHTHAADSRDIVIAGERVRLSWEHGDPLADLVAGAFIVDPHASEHTAPAVATARLHLVASGDGTAVSELATAIACGLVAGPGVVDIGDHRLHIDIASGVTTVLHRPSRTVAILRRRLAELDPRACITPFRIAIAWLADGRGGEMLHAACVERDGRVIALAGTPGAGKSTLAHSLVARGWRPVGDDAIFWRDERVFPVYRRAKWPAPDGSSHVLATGKPFSDLGDLSEGATGGLPLHALVFPRISARFGIVPVPPADAVQRLADACLPEVAGGLPASWSRLQVVVQHVPALSVSLGPEREHNAQAFEQAMCDG